LPDPETPLTTVSLPWGISQEMFFRLWVRAPRITIASFAEVNGKAPERKLDGPVYRPEGLKAQSSNLHYKLSASDFSPWPQHTAKSAGAASRHTKANARRQFRRVFEPPIVSLGC
jgi:hypothetical protein